MKRGVVIFLIGIIALMATNAIEVLKVPQLAKHFVEHTRKNPGLSFVDFMLEHYSSLPHTDGDAAEDMKLPFKVTSYTANIISFFFTPQTGLSIPSPLYREQPESLYAFVCIPSGFAHSIWQPPKNA